MAPELIIDWGLRNSVVSGMAEALGVQLLAGARPEASTIVATLSQSSSVNCVSRTRQRQLLLEVPGVLNAGFRAQAEVVLQWRYGDTGVGAKRGP